MDAPCEFLFNVYQKILLFRFIPKSVFDLLYSLFFIDFNISQFFQSLCKNQNYKGLQKLRKTFSVILKVCFWYMTNGNKLEKPTTKKGLLNLII